MLQFYCQIPQLWHDYMPSDVEGQRKQRADSIAARHAKKQREAERRKRKQEEKRAALAKKKAAAKGVKGRAAQVGLGLYILITFTVF